MKPEFFDTYRQVDYIILKDGVFYAEAWYLGFYDDCHEFVHSGGTNCRIYIKDLSQYSFAESII